MPFHDQAKDVVAEEQRPSACDSSPPIPQPQLTAATSENTANPTDWGHDFWFLHAVLNSEAIDADHWDARLFYPGFLGGSPEASETRLVES